MNYITQIFSVVISVYFLVSDTAKKKKTVKVLKGQLSPKPGIIQIDLLYFLKLQLTWRGWFGESVIKSTKNEGLWDTSLS